MGRSRGGLTTKIHALVDSNGLPIVLKLTAGQAHDGKSAQDMLGRLKKGNVLLADRAYDSDALRTDMIGRGVWPNIRPMPGRKQMPLFGKVMYQARNAVERLLPPFGRCLRPNKIKHYRAVATRYDKRDDNFLASVQLASIRIWLRFNEFVA